jgi:hypothetical protein
MRVKECPAETKINRGRARNVGGTRYGRTRIREHRLGSAPRGSGEEQEVQTVTEAESMLTTQAARMRARMADIMAELERRRCSARAAQPKARH